MQTINNSEKQDILGTINNIIESYCSLTCLNVSFFHYSSKSYFDYKNYLISFLDSNQNIENISLNFYCMGYKFINDLNVKKICTKFIMNLYFPI